MMEAFGERQQALIRLLFRKKQGLTLDELAESLKITRTAVRQHVSALERMGYIDRGELLATGGRPVQVYRLTAKGCDLFPKQYSWFSELLVQAVEKEKGREGLKVWMGHLGEMVASGLSDKISSEDLLSRTQKTVQIMNELAYEAEVLKSPDPNEPNEPNDPKETSAAIEATNCVYHNLAAQYPEVCQFDISLLAKLTRGKVVHEECIVRGGNVCRFKIKKIGEK